MIFCNLKTLLAQRNITVSKISADTKISRSTITALCANRSGGIQFETLDTICGYLKVLPSDVIMFSPYSIEFSWDRDDLSVTVTNKVNGKKLKLTLFLDSDTKYGIYFNHSIDDEIKVFELKKIIDSLPQYYISHLDEEVKNLLSRDFDPETVSSFSIISNLY